MERWGLTLPLPSLPLRQHAELVRRAEAAGYTDLWSGETQGPDGFTPLALAAGWTERARLGTGVVGVFTRGPALLAQQAAALADASEGRFALGIGASSDRIVSGWNGIPFERPLSKVSETVDFVAAAPAGGPLALFMFAAYVSVPVYAAFYRWLGYGEKIAEMCEAWAARDRERALAAAPWGLIEETFIFGEPAAMRERLEEFVAGGITLP